METAPIYREATRAALAAAANNHAPLVGFMSKNVYRLIGHMNRAYLQIAAEKLALGAGGAALIGKRAAIICTQIDLTVGALLRSEKLAREWAGAPQNAGKPYAAAVTNVQDAAVAALQAAVAEFGAVADGHEAREILGETVVAIATRRGQ